MAAQVDRKVVIRHSERLPLADPNILEKLQPQEAWDSEAVGIQEQADAASCNCKGLHVVLLQATATVDLSQSPIFMGFFGSHGNSESSYSLNCRG
jgi:hypothetical protein